MIREVPISLGSKVSSDEINSGFPPIIINGYADENGFVHKFSGYTRTAHLGTGHPVNGLFTYRDTYYYDAFMTIAVSGGRVFFIYSSTANKGLYGELTISDSCNISTSMPVVMANVSSTTKRLLLGNDMNWLAIADGTGPPVIASLLQGGAIGYLNTRIVDYEAPNPCSHVVGLDGYMIGNNVGSQTFDYSYPNSAERWDGDFASAESNLDDITAMLECQRKLVVAGNNSIEIWRNDGSTPWIPSYNHIDTGLYARYSICNCDGVLYWIDNKQRLVRCDIASSVRPEEVSTTLSAYLSGKEIYVDDCIARYAEIDERKFYIMSFNSIGKTIAVDTSSGLWFELAEFNTNTGAYEQLELVHFDRNDGFGLCLAGGRLDDNCYSVGRRWTKFQDREIRTLIRTPTIDWGTSDKKFVSKIIIAVQRTQFGPNRESPLADTGSFDPKILLRWRDDGETNWTRWRSYSLTPSGSTTWDVEFRRCGSYVCRQYELVILGDMHCCIKYFKEAHR